MSEVSRLEEEVQLLRREREQLGCDSSNCQQRVATAFLAEDRGATASSTLSRMTFEGLSGSSRRRMR